MAPNSLSRNGHSLSHPVFSLHDSCTLGIFSSKMNLGPKLFALAPTLILRIPEEHHQGLVFHTRVRPEGLVSFGFSPS